MKQVRVHAVDDVRLDDVAAPSPTSRDVVLKVDSCGICGTDLSYIARGGLAGPGVPMPLGHEVAGVVDWVGADVHGTSSGDRVVLRPGVGEQPRIGNGAGEGGLTPSLLVRDAAAGGRLYRVPVGMPLDVAALTEPLAVGMQAVNRAEVGAADQVAVFGCGPIGLFAIATLIDRGLRDVVAVDLSDARLSLASQLGASFTINPSQTDVWAELARVHGTAPFLLGATPATQVFIEATGAARVITDIVNNCAFGARLSVVALHFQPIPTSFLLVLMKQLTIYGSFEYPPRFEDAIELLGRTDLSGVITHRFPLDDFDAAIDVLRGTEDCGKVLVTMAD